VTNRHLLLSIVALGLAAITMPAFAADFPVKAPAREASYDWTGFYVGINGGYGLARDPSSTTIWFYGNPVESFSNGPQGVLGGVQIGYNWQWQHLVVGAETDFQFSGQKDTVCMQRCMLGVPGVTDQALLIEQKMPWFGTVRGRLGWAEGPALIYATGGLAYGRVDTNASYRDGTVTNLGASHIQSGWTVGAGVETALSGGWTAKAEYLYVNLGSVTDTFQWGVGVAKDTVTGDIRNNVFRVGLNYRLFDGRGYKAYASADSMASAAPAVSWNGLHVGINAGYAAARSPVSYDAVVFQPQGERFNLDPSGAIGGGQIGFDRQFARWVVGVETDIQASGQRSSADCVISCTTATNARLDQKVTWFGTTRARLGWTTGAALLYGTGGLAYGKVNTHAEYRGVGLFAQPMSATGDASGVKSGWTVGGGIETKLGGQWSAKIEYLYVDLGSQSVSYVNNFGAGNTNTTTVSSSIREHIARLGVNYTFN
jgi:outer membrane immunogenic protein